MNKNAFTLAEVLITLGIIGVVAAMTLPALIQNHTNKTVATKLKKFYTQINQAIMLSEAEYGDRKYWYSETNSVETDKDGNPIAGSSTSEKWFNKYISTHLKIIDTKYDENARPTFYFADGTALKMMGANLGQESFRDGEMRDWLFYTTTPEKCHKLYGTDSNSWENVLLHFFIIQYQTTQAFILREPVKQRLSHTNIKLAEKNTI